MLEAEGELVHVGAELSTKYEAASAIKILAHEQGKAVLLDKAVGYDIPIVGNLLGTNRRLAIALNVDERDLGKSCIDGGNNPIQPILIDNGPVQETVLSGEIDILKTVPVLTHHQKDAGPYMTCAFTVAKDTVTGIRGMGIHRIQIKTHDKIGIFLASRPLSNFLAKAEELNQPLDIAIVSGADPVTYFASAQSVAEESDKYDFAGGLARAPIELVKCKSVDIEVPAHAEFVLEGHLIPRHREREGPFGESTGYYLTYNNPVAQITVITHRRNPIYQALVPFGPEEAVLQFIKYKIDTLIWLQGIVPSVKEVHCPAFGVVYVQVEKWTQEDAFRIIRELFHRSGAPYAKIVVVVDTDVDITDPKDMAWALGSRVRPQQDVLIESDLPGLVIDPATSLGDEGELPQLQPKTAKIGIDGTKPLGELDKYERIEVPPDTKRKIAELLGLSY